VQHVIARVRGVEPDATEYRNKVVCETEASLKRGREAEVKKIGTTKDNGCK